MRFSTDVALKEWAIVCAALRSGRQSVLLRKGGLRERAPRSDGPRSDTRVGPPPRVVAGGFEAVHRSFYLYPTYFHTREPGRERDLVPQVHDEAARLDQAAPPGGELHIDLAAQVSAAWFVEDPERLHAIGASHIFSTTCVEGRFHYRRPGLWALLLRVYALPRPRVLIDRPAYSGCVSWVHLQPALTVEGLAPVLSDPVHARREAALRRVLGDPAPLPST